MTDALSPRGAVRAGCALTLTGLALSLAACGGSGDDSANASSSEADRDAARVRLQQCLRKQGVELPGPGSGNQTRPSQAELTKVRKAMEGPCKKYQKEAFGDISEEDRQEMRDRMVKFTSCMRREGVDLPDFRPGPGERGVQTFRANRNSPRFKKAEEKCRKLLPRPPGGQGRGPGGPGIMIGPPPGGSE